MDDIVAKAMQKWPDVPDVYGWLGLDRRGNWLLRGERIGNAALNAFISRNYTCDPRGRWYFQNGPQRVFVSLAATPYVFSLQRLQDSIVVTTHTGDAANTVTAAVLDDNGGLILDTDLGCGLVQDRDLAIALEACRDAKGGPATERSFTALRRGDPEGLRIDFGTTRVKLETIAADGLAARFLFDPDPKPPMDAAA